MVRLLIPSTVFAALFACTPYAEKDNDEDGVLNGVEETAGTDPDKADSDDDGLSDGAEADLGADPLDADSDGDGLDDGAEVDEFNTDPIEPDSDGDGYEDGDEIDAGSDPDDDDSMIYEGGWPYQADKDDFQGPDLEDADADEGELFARLQLEDQFGETFDLYDLAGHGKPILVDISAIWCGPCNGLSQWLSGEGDDYNWDSYYGDLKTSIDNGDIYWVTILGEDNSGADPDLADIQRWDEKYPNELIPVLVGNSDVAAAYISYAWPSAFFLSENMEILSMPSGDNAGHYQALDAAAAWQPE